MPYPDVEEPFVMRGGRHKLARDLRWSTMYCECQPACGMSVRSLWRSIVNLTWTD